MKQSGCLSLIKCTIQTTMCMQVRWTTTGQIINHLIVVHCIQPINKPVSEDMWPQLQPKSYVQKQHIPLGALGTWARPDLRCTFSPKNHNTPWDQRGVFFPRPPRLKFGPWRLVVGTQRREEDSSQSYHNLQRSRNTFNMPPVCVHTCVSHYQLLWRYARTWS